MSNIRVNGASLRTFYCEALHAAGLSKDDANVCADGLYYADIHGLDSHGIQNFERIYLREIHLGLVNPTAKPKIVAKSNSVATVDGCNAIGFVTACFAMDLAIQSAKLSGAAVVAVRNSSHCGSMGIYTNQARAEGMIGIALTNLGRQAILRPLGGRNALLGTNVIAAAAPAGTADPFNFDASMAVASTCKIRLAEKRCQTLPEGWLAGENGESITDPRAFKEGTGFLQFVGGSPDRGGHKGYGLALLADILCGVLSGASVGPNASNLEQVAEGDSVEGKQNIGHFFLALDIAQFREPRAFEADMDQMLEVILGCPTDSLTNNVIYPGYPEANERRRRSANGICISEETLSDLMRIADDLRIAPPLLSRATHEDATAEKLS